MVHLDAQKKDRIFLNTTFLFEQSASKIINFWRRFQWIYLFIIFFYFTYFHSTLSWLLAKRRKTTCLNRYHIFYLAPNKMHTITYRLKSLFFYFFSNTIAQRDKKSLCIFMQITLCGVWSLIQQQKEHKHKLTLTPC